MFRNTRFFQNPSRLQWLIFACLLLLGISQVLWIKRVWNEQKEVLQREINYVFGRTVMSMQDSLIRRISTKNGAPLDFNLPMEREFLNRAVSAPGRPPMFRSGKKIDIRREFRKTDTPQNNDDPVQQVQVYVTSTDTQSLALQHGLGRLLLNVRSDSINREDANIVFEIQADTISPEELRRSYAAAIDNAGLPSQFELKMAISPADFSAGNSITTEPALGGLMRHHFFRAEFHQYHGYLLQKILPYALFSLLLFSLTSVAFWLIFHTLKQQQKLAQQKNEFISNVTHELKTPLTTVGVALEALNDFEVLRNPEKTKEYLQISKLELDRLNLLVDKVLRLSMFEQQALQLRPEPLDFKVVAQQVVAAMTLQANQVGAIIHFTASQQPCWVHGDRLHLTGVVYNLLDNALKYRSEKPVVEVKIDLQTLNGQSFACLQVADNGVGIAPEFLEQVFEKFFRVPTGNTHNVKGHGLGLSYVAHVAREHGGNIRVESQLGKGSVFTLEIPAVTPPPGA